MGGSLPADDEKRRFCPLGCQQLQQRRRGKRVRAVIEGQGHCFFRRCPPADDRQEKAEAGEKGRHPAQQDKACHDDDGQPRVDKRQQSGPCQRADADALPQGQTGSAGRACAGQAAGWILAIIQINSPLGPEGSVCSMVNPACRSMRLFSATLR